MLTKNPEETIVEIAEDEDGVVKELYLATNPYGNFVVEFVLLSYESNESILWKYKFHMYNVNKSEQDEYSDPKARKKSSSRNFSKDISKPKTFKFTETQSKLITENKLSWSVAVSDKLYKDKSHESTA
ncbi:3945_t:CDS:2, partial [Gigaspora rosea]